MTQEEAKCASHKDSDDHWNCCDELSDHGAKKRCFTNLYLTDIYSDANTTTLYSPRNLSSKIKKLDGGDLDVLPLDAQKTVTVDDGKDISKVNEPEKTAEETNAGSGNSENKNQSADEKPVTDKDKTNKTEEKK